MDALYFFEHKLLPHMIFNEPVQASILIPNDPAVLHKVCEDVYKQHGEENPHSEDEFDAKGKKIDEKTFSLKITFPEPEKAAHCYHSYMMFNDEFNKIAYFCIEKNSETDEIPMLCAWDREGNHYNYGKCSMENDADFERCVEIYKSMEINSSINESNSQD